MDHVPWALLCQHFDNAGTKSGFGLSEHAVRYAGAVVGDRKLPICSRHIVGNGNHAVLCCFVECVLEGIDDELSDN